MSNNADVGKYAFGILGSTCLIKASGKLSYRISGSLDSFISRLFQDNTLENFIIDLSEAEYLDSTNLGLLARIQALSVGRTKKHPSLISTNETVNSILQNHGFDQLFDIVETMDISSVKMCEISDNPKSSPASGNTLLAAHKYLADTNQENAGKFSEIIRLMEKDLEK